MQAHAHRLPHFFATPLDYKEPNMTQQSRTGGQILVDTMDLQGIDQD
ncbi:hypothetical protein IR096_09270, partial [Lactobacillus johnsonii]|nr:hypothetical protein [Lactobacillus johnsonii]